MSDSKKEAAEGSTARGADWEVVTLTASAYAAAPGPSVGPVSAEENTSKVGQDSSNALLMSDHFVFPPSEHENLPIETSVEEDPAEEDPAEEDVQESTSTDDASFKSAVAARSERVQYYDEGKNLSADEAEMLGDVADGFVVQDDDKSGDSQDKSDVPTDSKSRGSGGAPCPCWLKKHMSCLYDQAKDTNALWSVVVAAAFVGLVILWRKDRLHINCLKWRSSSAVR